MPVQVPYTDLDLLVLPFILFPPTPVYRWGFTDSVSGVQAKYYFDVPESIPEGLHNSSHRWFLWNDFVYGTTPEELNDTQYFSI